ncbi:MAG TPA: hypothetical protein VM658_15875 [bacterium]|nr:hypothetical protein [bacterium]
MRSSSDNLDAGRAVQIASEINRTCAILRNAYLQSKRDELLPIFQSYKDRVLKLERPDSDAILLGFREEWKKKNYADIVKVGGLLDSSFFLDNREAEAYYLASKKYLLK